MLGSVIMIAVTGCSGGFVSDTGCSWVRPILLSSDDIMTSETEIEIIAHNEIWERFCSEE